MSIKSNIELLEITLKLDPAEKKSEDELIETVRNLREELIDQGISSAKSVFESTDEQGVKGAEILAAGSLALEVASWFIPDLVKYLLQLLKKGSTNKITLTTKGGSKPIEISYSPEEISQEQVNSIVASITKDKKSHQPSKIKYIAAAEEQIKSSRKIALIVGNSDYSDRNLSSLAAPVTDVKALGEVLRDPKIGGFDEVVEVINQPLTEVKRAIAVLFMNKKREDLILLYFSGHGVLNDQGRLFLAVRDTEKDLLKVTALEANFITDEMDSCISQRQVLILDCCHSGAFARGAKGSLDVRVGTSGAFEGNGYGRIVLTATDTTQYAWEGEQIIGDAENSMFTHYLVEGLTTGKADTNSDGLITINELYDYVYSEVIGKTSKQTPGKWTYKQKGELVIAKNPCWEIHPSPLPPDLKHAMESNLARVREGAVNELKGLLKSKSLSDKLAAEKALASMVHDDSKLVSKAAEDAIGESKVEAPPPQPPPPQPPDEDRSTETPTHLSLKSKTFNNVPYFALSILLGASIGEAIAFLLYQVFEDTIISSSVSSGAFWSVMVASILFLNRKRYTIGLKEASIAVASLFGFIFIGLLIRKLTENSIGYDSLRWGISSAIYWASVSLGILFGFRKRLRFSEKDLLSLIVIVTLGAFVGDIGRDLLRDLVGWEISRFGLESAIFWPIFSLAALKGIQKHLQITNSTILKLSLLILLGSFLGGLLGGFTVFLYDNGEIPEILIWMLPTAFLYSLITIFTLKGMNWLNK